MQQFKKCKEMGENKADSHTAPEMLEPLLCERVSMCVNISTTAHDVVK